MGRLILLFTIVLKGSFHCKSYNRAVINVWSSTVERVKTELKVEKIWARKWVGSNSGPQEKQFCVPLKICDAKSENIFRAKLFFSSLGKVRDSFWVRKCSQLLFLPNSISPEFNLTCQIKLLRIWMLSMYSTNSTLRTFFKSIQFFFPCSAVKYYCTVWYEFISVRVATHVYSRSTVCTVYSLHLT